MSELQRNFNYCFPFIIITYHFIDTMISNDWKIPVNEDDLDYPNILLDGIPI